MEDFRAELTLPNDERALGMARVFAEELTSLATLPEREGEALVSAAGEACRNVLQHAFEPGERGSFTIAGEVSAVELTLSIRDQGLPFDPAAECCAAPAGAVHGLERIREAVDEAHWINHGPEGKELRLVEYRPHAEVTEHLPEAELARFEEDAPPAPAQEYTIRRLRPEDALGVAQCVYRVYGYTYLHPELYYPERIAALNQSGELISVVALDEAGSVVGHLAFECEEGSRVAERGEAVVAPAHRGRGLLKRMRAALDEEGRAAGLLGGFADAVTSHPFSQRVDEDFGTRVCGILLGGWPGQVTYKKMTTEVLPQRMSYVVYFSYLADPPLTILHAPPRHREVLERIYSGLAPPLEWRSPEPPSGPGQVQVRYDRAAEAGTIRVRQVGADTAAEVCQARCDLCEVAGAEAVYLHLPLAQPGTPALCEAAEAVGFFFSGVGPLFAPDGDFLRLQYLRSPLDPALLQIFSPFARELLDYVVRERERVRTV